jgi:hypothetical protein
MSLQTQKLAIIESLIKINDTKALNKVKEIVTEYSKAKPAKKVKPYSLEEFYKKIEDSETAYQQGKIISSEQMRKKVKKWAKK